MPRFFFDINDGQRSPDEEGTVLKDASEARQQAIMTAGAIIRDDVDLVSNGAVWSMTVADERGTILCRLRFTAEIPD